MSYEILKDDITDKKSSKGNKKSGNLLKKMRINPMYIHISVIIIIILLLAFYFFNNFTFKFKDDNENKELITIVGDLTNFNEYYNKNFDLYSASFVLKTKNSKFDGKSQNIYASNFSGQIYLDNMSIIFEGTADKLEFGDSEINLKGEQFTLISKQKTQLNLQFETLNLVYKEGRIKIDNQLNYEFENSTILLHNFNCSFTYDGTFALVGETKDLSLQTKDPKVQISYANE